MDFRQTLTRERIVLIWGLCVRSHFHLLTRSQDCTHMVQCFFMVGQVYVSEMNFIVARSLESTLVSHRHVEQIHEVIREMRTLPIQRTENWRACLKLEPDTRERSGNQGRVWVVGYCGGPCYLRGQPSCCRSTGRSPN